MLREYLRDLSGDGRLTSSSGAIEPEHEGVLIDPACYTINDIVKNSYSRILVALWRIRAVV